jgi:diguanylate cyclase (GGDEF)-like protein
MASRSTRHLIDLLALVSSLPEGADVAKVAACALEHATGALNCQAGAVLAGREVVSSFGAITAQDGQVVQVPGMGPCEVLAVACDGLPDGRLLIARRSPAGYSNEERDLLHGFSRVLSLALRGRSTLTQERTQRAAGEERQVLLERLARIQRSISTRRPLHEVLEAIVGGATELIGDEVTGLRLIDPDDPSMVVLVASTGLSAEMQDRTRRSRTGEGIGGLAISRQAMVVSEDYGASELPLPAFQHDGVRAAMAAPVRQGDLVVGSLVVASRTRGRTYSATEQEMLLAFAEHAGLALNDARAVAALQQAVTDAARQARQDPLTGLPNRTDFLEKLRGAVHLQRPLSVLFLDLDDFKLVNDTLGHPVGDALLRLVGERIVAHVRGDDVVARLGGDEFAVLLCSTPPEQAERAAERIRQSLSQPFHLPGHLVSVGASTGVVLCSDAGEDSAEELLRDADVAMYQAKALGKGRAVLFASSMRIDLQARSRLESDLRNAIDHGELVAHYQPVLDVSSGQVVSSEALLRWHHPELGLVPPAEFIPVAEATGMIVRIGQQVLLDATRQTAEWNATRPGDPLTVSVNVSARQLLDSVIVKHVRGALLASGLPPEALTLELTESVLVHDINEAAATLAELKSLGVRLALDDFGTGYSSLSYLASLPFDVLKVDKAFVAAMDQGSSGKRLAAAVVALAQSLQMQTIVEGVESSEQLAAMRALGCTHFQGYLWSPPVPAEAFSALAAQLSGRRKGLPSPRQAWSQAVGSPHA